MASSIKQKPKEQREKYESLLEGDFLFSPSKRKNKGDEG
jgi:hypothetical protein